MTEFVLAVLGTALGVFAVSSVSKLRGRAAYLDYLASLRDTTLLSERALPGAAVLLVTGEAIVAVAAAFAVALVVAGLAGVMAAAGLALALACVLTAVLAAGVTVVLRRGITATCACFGARAGRPLGPSHLIRNVSLLVVLLAGLACVPFASARPSAPGSLLALAGGLVAALLFARWDDLAYLFSPATVTGPGR